MAHTMTMTFIFSLLKNQCLRTQQARTQLENLHFFFYFRLNSDLLHNLLNLHLWDFHQFAPVGLEQSALVKLSSICTCGTFINLHLWDLHQFAPVGLSSICTCGLSSICPATSLVLYFTLLFGDLLDLVLTHAQSS